MESKVFLITGGAGFVGHHFVEHFHKNFPGCKIIVLDRLTYAGKLNRLRDIHAYPNMDIQVLTSDFTYQLGGGLLEELRDVTHVIHIGAESHVDNSIVNPLPFIESNVVGTYRMLELSKGLDRMEAFYYFSTDEVFGPCYQNQDPYKEDDRFRPSNPYAAAKAGGEMLCMAYANTYNMPIVITRSMNIIGERQDPEKFIPMCISKILKGMSITIHADKTRTKPGSRQYIHARNVADGYKHLIDMDTKGGIYHITGEQEVDNLQVVKMIGSILGIEPRYEMVDFHSSRPGHDLRYALDGTLMKSLGWTAPKTFGGSLVKTVQWYIDNPSWLLTNEERLIPHRAYAPLAVEY